MGRSRVNEKDKSVVCSHCNRSGHEANSCFTLIGYPDWRGEDQVMTGKLKEVVGDSSPHSSSEQGLLNLLNSQKISNTKKMNGKQVS